MKRAIILGCSASSGVPMIGNKWGECDPSEPRNRRTRTSLALQSQDGLVVIDTGPDFKDQMNRENLSCPDAIIYTHAHNDHINGIDEVRWLAMAKKSKMPIYGNEETILELKQRFSYLFAPPRPDLYSSVVEVSHWNKNDFYKSHKVSDFNFDLIPLDHESVTCSGFRFGDFAYTVDVVRMEEKALHALKGIKNWVVDAGSYKNRANLVHASIQQVMEWNEVVGAENVYFSSMTIHMDYQTVLNETPDGYFPAYDGLVIPFNDGF